MVVAEVPRGPFVVQLPSQHPQSPVRPGFRGGEPLSASRHRGLSHLWDAAMDMARAGGFL